MRGTVAGILSLGLFVAPPAAAQGRECLAGLPWWAPRSGTARP